MSLVPIPRVELGIFPTPLHELRNLSQALGGPRIFIKREDLTGLAMGGNKTRQVECLLAYARGIGADVVVTTASSQSNYCLQLAAGARRLNMGIGLVHFSGRHPEQQGNLLLENIIGSRLKIIEGDIMTSSFLDNYEEEMEKIAREFRAQGHTPCVINLFKPSPHFRLCAGGWVHGAEELCQQLKDQNIDAQYLVLASSSGCTAAGLILGLRLLKSPLKVISIAVSRSEAITRDKILNTANDTADFIGADIRFSPEDIVINEYIGEGYGIVSRECLEAMQLLARTEGIFLDPVYSGKGMAGLIDLIRQGELTAKDTVIFLHTGGTPAIFAYHQEMVESG